MIQPEDENANLFNNSFQAFRLAICGDQLFSILFEDGMGGDEVRLQTDGL